MDKLRALAMRVFAGLLLLVVALAVSRALNDGQIPPAPVVTALIIGSSAAVWTDRLVHRLRNR